MKTTPLLANYQTSITCPKNHSEYSEKQLRRSDQNSALPEHNSDLQNKTPDFRMQLRASERNSELQNETPDSRNATPSLRTQLRNPGTQLRASERNSEFPGTQLRLPEHNS